MKALKNKSTAVASAFSTASVRSTIRDAVLPERILRHSSRPVTEASPATALRVAHLGTFPPRKCGIATYTQDVVHALQNHAGGFNSVIAMTDPEEGLRYDRPVQYEIPQNEVESYSRVARQVNRSGSDLVNIQYEHGIFGGECGSHLSYFLDELKIPAVATLHTVLPEPSDSMIRAIRSLAARTEHLIVLNSKAIPLLRKAYGVTKENISVIPHGTPHIDRSRRPMVRDKFDVRGQTVLSTFGLIGPDKGLEYAIDAVAKIADANPTLHYYILGQTHPNIVRHSGEVYRESLQRRAEEAGIADRVHFVNSYLTLSDLTDWLMATDMYISPYLNPNQIVSGTLAYAVAAGKPVMATPYLHAQELLGDGRGILVPFRDADAMAQRLNDVLNDPQGKAELESKAWSFGRTSQWSEVAKRYNEVFAQTLRPNAPLLTERTPSRLHFAI